MLGIPIGEGNSDSQDLNRTIETLVPQRGAVAGRGDGDGGAADRRRDRHPARRAALLLHVPAPADGPVRAGPGGADRPPRRRVRVLGRRAGAAAVVAARDPRTTTCSAPSPAWSQRPGHGLRAEADGARREVHGRDRPRQAALDPAPTRVDAAPGAGALAGARRGRGDGLLQGRAQGRRPAGGPRGPWLQRGGPLGPRRGPRPGAGRLRLAARRRQAGAADGLERGRADRLARLRRAAGGALARAAEPGRLLQGDGRGGHQSRDRPRAGDRALLHARDLRAPAGDRGPGHPLRHRRHRHPRAAGRPSRHGSARRQRLPQDRRRARHLPAGGSVGGVPRPARQRPARRLRQGDRHRPAGVRDHPGRDRAPEAGCRQGHPRRGRAAGADRPRRLRR